MDLLRKLCFICLFCADFATVINGGYTHYRLPTAIKPKHYDLKIITHLESPENATFNGEVSIELDILEDTKNITLHAKNLTINETQIDLKRLDGDFHWCLEGIEIVSEHDYYIILLCEALLGGGKYELHLNFGSTLNENIQGYFVTTYEDESTNETKWMAATDFQPTYARMAFPCWDEPNYKATFTIWLGHSKSLNALSNMPLDQETPLEGLDNYVWSKFQESVVMSTYLVAFSINEFVSLKSGDNASETEFRIWCRKDKSASCEYAAEVSPKILKYLEEKLKLPNPLKIIDQIAVPNYPSEGMENWGLVVYSESYVYIDSESIEKQFLREYLVNLIAHELVHQWFGNIVTMKWWTDTWLNEGFAKYFGFLAAKDFLADQNTDYNLFLHYLEIVHFDSKLQTHPVSLLVTNATELEQSFDAVSYIKGWLILRMVHIVLGHEAFFQALQAYLEKYQYRNVEQSDLFKEFSKKSRDIGPNMETILYSWTLQPGYPLVKIWRNYEDGSVDISQQRFLTEPRQNSEDADKCWWIPLSYTSSSESDFANNTIKSWLECDERTKNKPLRLYNVAESNDWIIFNIQLSGFYRVMYDPKNWQLITNTLLSDQYTKIHVFNRAQLVGDAIALACNGHQEYDIAFGILEYLSHEYEYPPWKSAWDELEKGSCESILKTIPKYRIYYNAFMRNILKPVFNHVSHSNTTDEGHERTLLRVLISNWAVNVDLEKKSQKDIESFQKWKSLPDPDIVNPIQVYSRKRIYCQALKFGNASEWNFLWQRLQYNSGNSGERKTILQSLNCTSNENLLKSYLHVIFSNECALENDEKQYAFITIINNESGLRLAREFCMKHIEELHTKTDVNFLFDQMASKINTMEDLNTHIQFIQNHRKYFENADDKINMIRENNLSKIQWIEDNLDKIISYLDKRLSRMGVEIANEVN
ncbi:glutamyl aminopeptidase-like [Musca domestica]|uniref:Aminopeptidase n=1 Tax=Musca domestica TaxID=7370 RepID=A0A9J7I3D7_MUSDO|nr:glutamyl aminopeptidase-like [Musca domestica]